MQKGQATDTTEVTSRERFREFMCMYVCVCVRWITVCVYAYVCMSKTRFVGCHEASPEPSGALVKRGKHTVT
jgi:hypothetical protein